MMRETSYSFVSSVSQYETIFENDNKDGNHFINEMCTSYCRRDLNDEKYSNDCANSVQYLTKLSEKFSHYRARYCVHLYFWLYKYILAMNESPISTLKMYQTIENVYKENNLESEACENYTQYINKDTFDRIDILIKLHNNFDKFESSSEKTQDKGCVHAYTCYKLYESHAKEFYKDGFNELSEELENFKERYDSSIKYVNTCGEEVPKTLPSIRGKNTVAIAVPFVVVLLISLVLFILYKLNLFPVWLKNRIRSKKLINDYISQGEEQFIKTCEGAEKKYKGRPYNIAYHSV
ncbi:PIR protein [Plasmodium ovale]|uniref:PIR Superfamily Protein n=2 Tax=Plasmodium ovale TaxID=36330 RepID=A0A1A8WQA8_PLAOA|nr:PIR Superfamily Protein [Plasmodium ovale curtisi]SBT84723.1 PIR protein [Plasmodium ovale]